MQIYTKSLKQQIIEELYISSALSEHDDHFEKCVKNIMSEYGLSFLPILDIDADIFVLDVFDIEQSFIYATNCLKFNQLPYFAQQCEAFIDFSPVLPNYNVDVAVPVGASGRLMEVTLFTPNKLRA